MKIKKNGKIIGLLIIVLFSLSLTLKTNNVSAFYNWVEWEGVVTGDWGNLLNGATVKLKRGSTTLETTITEDGGKYEIREYVDTTDYLTLHVSKADYTSTSIHVLSRDMGEPWPHDFTIYYVVTYAVIVGLNTYDDNSFNNLLYCENDADDWNVHLSNSSGLDFDYIKQYEDSTTDHNGQATEKRVTDALSDVVADADGGDIIAFIFSGHGDDGSGDEYSLCMWDAENGQEGKDGYLNHTELADIFDGCEAERIFFFFDCCHSYGMKNALAEHTISDNYFIAAAADT
ncbi:MAG: caspase family protein, partial [Candidatus Heimdallarchaeaceae archaeon]